MLLSAYCHKINSGCPVDIALYILPIIGFFFIFFFFFFGRATSLIAAKEMLLRKMQDDTNRKAYK